MKYIKRFEGVGDEYAHKKFKINKPFTDFEKKYKYHLLSKGKEEIINAYVKKFGDLVKLKIVKNPSTLENIEPNVRGIIDKKGNLFLEARQEFLHDVIINALYEKGYIEDNDNLWHINLPENFVTIQRYDDTNKFYLGESNEAAFPPERKEIVPDRYEHLPSFEEILKEYQKFLDKAKIKNPKYEFVNMVYDYADYFENKNKSRSITL